MNLRLSSVRFVLAALVLVAAPVLRAQDGAEGALARARQAVLPTQSMSRLSGSTVAVADFDGDNKQDGAVVLETGSFLTPGSFQIELHFTGRDNAKIAFQSAEPDIMVDALDIDHDGDFDILIEQSLTYKRLQVWLNDGRGNFAKGRIEDMPSAVAPSRDRLMASGCADCVTISLPTQRGFETMLMACHIVGRPPSDGEFAVESESSFVANSQISLATPRAPPLS